MGQQNNESYQSASTLKIIASIIMCFLLLITVAGFLIAIIELITYLPYQNSDPFYLISDFGAVLAILSSLSDIFWVVVDVVFVIFFLIWVFRVFKNLRAVQVQGLKSSPGWAVGWYFIPIAWFFMPYIVMKETWLASFHAGKSFNWRKEKAPALLLTWWLTFIFGNYVSSIGAFASYETIGDYKIDAIVRLFSEPLLFVSGICLLIIMHKLTKVQDNELTTRTQLQDNDEEIVSTDSN